MRHDLKLAVRSSVGVTLTIVMHPHHQFTLTSIDHFTDVSDITTSLRLPLSWARMKVGSMIIFYAEAPGAFVDLAADLGYSLHLSQGTIVLDQDLAPPVTESASPAPLNCPPSTRRSVCSSVAGTPPRQQVNSCSSRRASCSATCTAPRRTYSNRHRLNERGPASQVAGQPVADMKGLLEVASERNVPERTVGRREFDAGGESNSPPCLGAAEQANR